MAPHLSDIISGTSWVSKRHFPACPLLAMRTTSTVNVEYTATGTIKSHAKYQTSANLFTLCDSDRDPIPRQEETGGPG